MRLNFKLGIIFILLLAMLGIAQSKSVGVDEILSKNGQLRLLPTLTYINIKSSNPLLTSIPIMLPNNSVINAPVVSGYNNLNQDYFDFSLMVRYGVYNRVELFSTLNAFYQRSRRNISDSFSNESSGNFGAWNLGFLVEAKKEGKAPALLVGASTDIMNVATFNDSSNSLQYFKGYSIFLTSFYTVDPIVFLIQANIRINLQNSFKTLSINNGEIFSLNPTIYFAVNPYISLNFGIKYQYNTQDFVNGRVVAALGSSFGYNFGIAYEIKQNLILFTSAERLDTSSYISNSVNISFSYRI
ncbi:hypothetical protein [Helicobacter muridarum]|nr:hypothetical protein [Helicobacter muridarum]